MPEIGVIGRRSILVWSRVPESPASHSPTMPVVNSNAAALAHYFVGNGQPAELGPSVRMAIMNSEEQRYRSGRFRTGETDDMFSSYYRVDMRLQGAYFVGRTNIYYSTMCQSGTCTTTYRLTNGDGFWDILRDKDGPGPSHEVSGGTPYRFMPFRWQESFPDPDRDGP